MAPKLFVATKAFIINKDKILILRESAHYSDGSNAGKFDVPGGRLEPGQHLQDSLLREIKEETSLDVKVGEPFFVNEWRPTVRNEQWQIVGIFFECFSTSPEVSLSSDHNEFKWISCKEFKNYAIIDNLRPAFEAYSQKTS